MYRTHEVRGNPGRGAVSVVDLKTGETKVLVQDVGYDALDGTRWSHAPSPMAAYGRRLYL